MQYINPPKPTRWADTLPNPLDSNDRTREYIPAGSAPCYDIAGNLLFQHSMDAGDRWMMTDAAGKPMFAWDYNERTLDNGNSQAERRLFRTRYDALHRPVEQWLRINDDAPALIEAFEYCDTRSPNGATSLDDARARNLIGQAVRHYDPSGLATVERVDFKGAVEEVTRGLVKTVETPVIDWSINGDSPADWLSAGATLLEPSRDTFRQITEYDALGRMTRLYNWHRDITFGAPGGPQATPGQTDRVAVYVPQYNARGVLQAETLHVRASKMTDADGHAQAITSSARSQQAIQAITYNAKGQKLSQTLGKGTITEYAYDERTFRLLSLRTTRPVPPGDACASAFVDQRVVQALRYTYDPVGNIAQIEDAAQATQFGSNQRIDPINRYEYDALYRLISATGKENGIAAGPPLQTENWPVFDGCPAPDPSALRNYVESYRYDSVGNFLQMHHEAGPLGNWTRDYRYAFDDPTQPASNQLWQTTAAGVTTTYRYDPHGSMLNLANTAPSHDIRWDWRDMIRHLDLIGGGHAYYNYGIDKQRTRKRLVRNPAVNNGTVKEDRIYLGGYELYRRYTDDPDDPIEEIESHHLFEGEQRVLLVDDVIKAKPARQPGPNGLRVREQTLFRYQYGNHLGSVGLELDETARVISYEEFHPYGTNAYRLMSSALEAPAKRYRYTGMERDEESGLSLHAARFFLTCIGRWISSDPVGISYSINSYCYADNTPVRLLDRNGRQAIPPEIARLTDEQRKNLLNPPLIIKPLSYVHNSDSAPALRGNSQSWDPRWETAQYQKQLAQDIHYRDHPLELLNDKLEKHAEGDLVRWISNWGPLTNMIGPRSPASGAPTTRGAPTYERIPPGMYKPQVPTLSNGFSPRPVSGSVIPKTPETSKPEQKYEERPSFIKVASNKQVEQMPRGLSAMSTAEARLRAKGIEVLDIVIIAKTDKPLPDVKDVVAQIKKLEGAVNPILKKEGMIGLKSRITEFRIFRDEINKMNAEIRASLGEAGPGKAWLHEGDTVLLNEPFIIKEAGDARVNSILGANNRRLAEEILNLPDDIKGGFKFEVQRDWLSGGFRWP